MLPELYAARDELSRYQRRLGGNSAIGIGIGLRAVHGVRLLQPCVQVYVEHKQPRRQLVRSERIPASIDGVEIDVVESTVPSLCGLMAPTRGSIRPAPPVERLGRSQYRPLVGGISCSNLFVPSGTLGCFCYGKDNRGEDAAFILGCGHVLRGRGLYKSSPNVIQASPSDGGCSRDTVATVERDTPLSPDPQASNIGDASIAKILPGIQHSNELLGLGAISGTGSPSLGMQVVKAGRTTGLTHGVVTCVGLETWVPWSFGDARVRYRFVDLVRIESIDAAQPFALPGDSGAVVATAHENKVVALHFAGADDGVFSLASPISHVETHLNVRLFPSC